MTAPSEAGGEMTLAEKLRRHLETLSPPAPTITYGALARAMGYTRPGALREITCTLERTMHADARAGRPFIAARAVSRVGAGLPARGFFDLAADLQRGPRDGETRRAFHTREIARLEQAVRDRCWPAASGALPKAGRA